MKTFRIQGFSMKLQSKYIYMSCQSYKGVKHHHHHPKLCSSRGTANLTNLSIVPNH